MFHSVFHKVVNYTLSGVYICVCVCYFRFECEGTVEEKISTLQVKKKELAQNVLSGTGSTFSKLSLADLRIIFGV